jgi:hypothetical protein
VLRRGVPALAIGLLGLLALGSLVRDVAQGLPWSSPIITTNFASSGDYARVGVALRKRLHGATVQSPEEIGTLAYFCDCAIVDEFSDRGQAIELIDRQRAKAGALSAVLLDVNYAWLRHDQKPRRLEYRLGYDPTPGSGPDVWPVHSDWRGTGHITLTRVP